MSNTNGSRHRPQIQQVEIPEDLEHLYETGPARRHLLASRDFWRGVALGIVLIFVIAAIGVTAKGQARATNPSWRANATWFSVPVPFKEARTIPAQARFITADGETLPAFRSTTVGVHTQFYDVYARFKPGQTITGDVAPLEQPATGEPVFSLSPWIADDVARVLPTFRVREGSTWYPSEPRPFVLVHGTDARQLWKRTTRVGPMVFEYWVTFRTGQDVAEWELLAVHSDPSSERMMISPDEIVAEFGEIPIIDNGAAHGLGPSRYDPSRDVWSIDLIPHRVHIGDAQGLPALSGAVLAVDNSIPLPQLLFSNDPRTQERIGNLIARLSGPISVTRDWADRWLAFQSTVPAHPNDAAQLAERRALDQRDMSGSLPYYGDRHRALRAGAGSTGGQFDFAASKGSELTLGDTRFSGAYRFALEGAFRPAHYRETSGAVVTHRQHPNWWTWSQITHYHCQISGDRLGKPCPVPRHGGTGFSGQDDQHRSANHLLACVANFDWPSARALLRDEIEVARANVRRQDTQHSGAARAFGRRMLADSNAFLLTGDEDVWRELVLFFAERGSHHMNTNTNVHLVPFDVVNDPRVIADVTAIMVWQQGLCLTGLAAAWNVHLCRESLGLPNYESTGMIETHFKRLAITLARLFRKDSNGLWYTFLSVAYDNGRGPGEAAMAGDTTGLTEGQTWLGSGWMEWIYPGLYYLARADHGIDLPAEEAITIAAIADELDNRIGVQELLSSREWFAVVPRGGK